MCSVVVTIVFEIARRSQALLAAVFFTVANMILLLPATMGTNATLVEWRSVIIAGLVTVLLIGSWLVFRWGGKVYLREREIWPFADGISILTLLSILAFLTFNLKTLIFDVTIRLYPFLMILNVFWITIIAYLFSLVVLKDASPPRRSVFRRVMSAVCTVLMVIASLDCVSAFGKGVEGRFNVLLNWHCPGILGLSDIGYSARFEGLKTKKMWTGNTKVNHLDVGLVAKEAYPQKRHHVVFFVADAMRRDHLGAYGAKGVKTPNIDRLAAESIIFEKSFSPAPGTGASVTSILTGLYPGTIANMDKVPLFLSSFLQNIKYTALSTHNVKELQLNTYRVLRGVSIKDLGLSLQLWLDSKQGAQTKDHKRVSELISGLKRTKGPVFEYVHLFATHGPFKTPSGNANYNSQISFVDTQLGRLVEFLKKEKLWDKTILAVLGDHGEGIGEHGMFAHSQALYQEQTAVPLIVHIPGREPERIASPTTINILPKMVMEALGGSWPFGMNNDLSGCSLDGLNKKFAVQEHMLGGSIVWRSIQYPPYAYHHKYLNNTEELYNLEADPLELEDVSEKFPNKLDDFRKIEEQIKACERSVANKML